MRIIKITAEERKRLKESMREATHPQSQRIQAILLNSKGYSISKIARMLDFHYNSVYRWLRRYIEHGVASLKDKKGRGRYMKIKKEDVPKIEEIINKNRMRIKASIPEIIKIVGVTVSEWTIKRMLKSQGYTNKRVRASLKSKQNSKDISNKKKD